MLNKKSRYHIILFRRAQDGRGLTGSLLKLLYVFFNECFLGRDYKWFSQIGNEFEIVRATHGSMVGSTVIVECRGGAEYSLIVGGNVIFAPKV